MQHDHVLKKWILTYWPHPPGYKGGGGGKESASKIFGTMLLHLFFFLIWFATWPCSEKVEFWPNPQGQGGLGVGSGERRGCRQNIWYHVAAFFFLFNLICNMTMVWKRWNWPFDPNLRGRGVGSWVGVWEQNICHHATAFVIPFNLICNMTLFWKSWILTFWPPPPKSTSGWDTGLGSKIALDMFHIYCTSVCMRNFSKKILTTHWVIA